ncbi:MAG: hypothetical protein ABIJ41_04155 [Candidatus Omnitrophota bacterium]
MTRNKVSSGKTFSAGKKILPGRTPSARKKISSGKTSSLKGKLGQGTGLLLERIRRPDAEADHYSYKNIPYKLHGSNKQKKTATAAVLIFFNYTTKLF